MPEIINLKEKGVFWLIFWEVLYVVTVGHGGSSVWQREIPGKQIIREQEAGLPRALHRFL